MRIDEFSVPDGAINAEDRTRFSCVGFDLTGSAPVDTWEVIYNGNSNDGGSVPVDALSPYADGDTVTVLGNTGLLTRTGYLWNTWNTASDGSGTERQPGTTFDIDADATLYAQWIATEPPVSGGGSAGKFALAEFILGDKRRK